MLAIIVGESKAEDSPGSATPSRQSHPTAGWQGLDLPLHEQKEPQPRRGVGGSAHTRPWFRGAPQRPPRLPHLPREDDQPKLVGHGHPPFPADKQPHWSRLSLEMFSGWFSRPAPKHHAAQEQHRFGGRCHNTSGSSPKPSPSHRPRAGLIIAVPWAGAPQPCSWMCLPSSSASARDTNIHSQRKTVTSVSHFLPFLACGEAPGLLSGHPRAGWSRDMEEEPHSRGFLQDRARQRVADPCGRRQGLCPRPVPASLCPVLRDDMGWPQPGHAGTSSLRRPSCGLHLQAHEPQTPCKTLGHHLFFFSLYHTDTSLPFFPFSVHHACSQVPDLCICLQDPDGRDIYLGWDFVDPTVIKTTLPAASTDGQHLPPPWSLKNSPA